MIKWRENMLRQYADSWLHLSRSYLSLLREDKTTLQLVSRYDSYIKYTKDHRLKEQP